MVINLEKNLQKGRHSVGIRPIRRQPISQMTEIATGISSLPTGGGEPPPDRRQPATAPGGFAADGLRA
jgi:hypothetical protein